MVFGITDNIRKAFAKARSQAGLSDVHFHDLRHTAATRLVRGGRPLEMVGRILGHTKAETTYRYVNYDKEDARASAEVLEGAQETVELVN